MNSDETFSKDCNELEKYSFWLDLFEGDQILIFCLSRTIFHSAVISMIPIGKKIKRQMGLGMSLMVRLMNSRTILSTLSLREKRLMKLKRVHPSHCWPCSLRDVTIDVNDDEKLKIPVLRFQQTNKQQFFNISKLITGDGPSLTWYFKLEIPVRTNLPALHERF